MKSGHVLTAQNITEGRAGGEHNRRTRAARRVTSSASPGLATTGTSAGSTPLSTQRRLSAWHIQLQITHCLPRGQQANSGLFPRQPSQPHIPALRPRIARNTTSCSSLLYGKAVVRTLLLLLSVGLHLCAHGMEAGAVLVDDAYAAWRLRRRLLPPLLLYATALCFCELSHKPLVRQRP